MDHPPVPSSPAHRSDQSSLSSDASRIPSEHTASSATQKPSDHTASSAPKKPSLALTTAHVRLFGPARPFFGSHTVEEAGGSVWLPTPVILVYRLLCTCSLLFSLVLFTATGELAWDTLGAWVFAKATLAMCAATFVSLCYLIAPERSSAATARGSFGLLADLAVPLMHSGISASIAVSIMYWPLLRVASDRPTAAEIVQYVVAALLLCGDGTLAFRMAFRFAYIAIAPAMGIVWLAFAWLRFAIVKSWPYPGLDYRKTGAARTVLFHIGMLIGAAALGMLVLLVNRLNRLPWVSARIRRRIADEEEASMASADVEGDAERGLDAIVFKNELTTATGKLSASLPTNDDRKNTWWTEAEQREIRRP